MSALPDEVIIARIEAARQRGIEGLFTVFKAFDGESAIYDDILGDNSFQLTWLGFFTLAPSMLKGFLTDPKSDPTANLARLRAKPTDTYHIHDNFSKSPFNWMLRILADLYTAEAIDRPVAHDGIANLLPADEFARLMRDAAGKHLAALVQVGDTSQTAIDLPKFNDCVERTINAYIYGVDAKEFADIVAAMLKKEHNLPEDPVNRATRFALADTLLAAVKAIAPHTGMDKGKAA